MKNEQQLIQELDQEQLEIVSGGANGEGWEPNRPENRIASSLVQLSKLDKGKHEFTNNSIG